MKDKRGISDDYFEYLLKQVLDEIADEEGAKLQEELSDIEDVGFSKEYYKAIDDIAKKRTKNCRLFKHIKVAIITLFVFCVGLTFAYNADADVKIFINKIFTNRGTQLDISYTELPLEYDFSEISESWEEFYVPEYIPVGYRVERIDGYYNSIDITYLRNENEIHLVERNDEEMSLSLDLEHTEYKETDINGSIGFLIVGEKKNMLYWEHNGIKMIISGNVESDEIIKMAKSIKAINRL